MNSPVNKQVEVRELGLIAYQEAWDEQERLFASIVNQKLANRTCDASAHQFTPNYLLFCEHPPVYTLGTSGHPENLLIDEARLATELGATFFKIRRGGDITFHGPGQLVGYPILDLDNFFTDIHRYMRLLEESIILTLADYGLNAGRIEGLTGVWLGTDEGNARSGSDQKAGPRDAGPAPRGPARKICAMGVKASRWVTMHGFALNVNTDLQYFNHIVPCGITDKAVTSLAVELGRQVPLAEVAGHVRRHMAALFEMELIEQTKT
ncbi:lipoyl(octanoyl) transferase LipB [Spirosoma areae]